MKSTLDKIHTLYLQRPNCRLYILLIYFISIVSADDYKPFGIPLYNYDYSMLPFNMPAFVTYVGDNK